MPDLVVSSLGVAVDVDADVLDILTIDEAKHALNIEITDTDNDDELRQVVTAASRVCDAIYGPVVTRAITKTVTAPAGVLVLGPPSSRTFTVTFTSVTEYASGTATVLTAETALASTSTSYRYLNGELRRRSSWTDASWGEHELVVVYTAGRHANTGAVAPQFKIAAKMVVAHLWQHFGAGSNAGVPSGDGPFFSAVPYVTEKMRKKLADLLPDEALMEAHGLVVA